MKLNDFFWLAAPLLLAFVATGILFDFHYFRTVDVQLHDTYYIVPPLRFCFLLWIILTLILFTIRGVVNKFTYLTTMVILLTSITIITVLTIMGIFGVLKMFSDAGMLTGFPFPLIKYKAIITGIVLVTVLVIAEVLLIHRFIKLIMGR